MPLSYDIARCGITPGNSDCPLAHRCLRRIDKGHPTRQLFSAFPGGEKCHGFWRIEEGET